MLLSALSTAAYVQPSCTCCAHGGKLGGKEDLNKEALVFLHELPTAAQMFSILSASVAGCSIMNA